MVYNNNNKNLKKGKKITETDSQMQKTNQGIKGRGIILKIGIDVHILFYMKQITNKNIVNSPGNSTQYPAMAYIGESI